MQIEMIDLAKINKPLTYATHLGSAISVILLIVWMGVCGPFLMPYENIEPAGYIPGSALNDDLEYGVLNSRTNGRNKALFGFVVFIFIARLINLFVNIQIKGLNLLMGAVDFGLGILAIILAIYSFSIFFYSSNKPGEDSLLNILTDPYACCTPEFYNDVASKCRFGKKYQATPSKCPGSKANYEESDLVLSNVGLYHIISLILVGLILIGQGGIILSKTDQAKGILSSVLSSIGNENFGNKSY